MSAVFFNLKKDITPQEESYRDYIRLKGKNKYKLILTEYLITWFPLQQKSVLIYAREHISGALTRKFGEIYFNGLDEYLKDKPSFSNRPFGSYIGGLLEEKVVSQESIEFFIKELISKVIEEEITIANIRLKYDKPMADEYRQLLKDLKIKEIRQKFLISNNIQEKIGYTISENDFNTSMSKLDGLLPVGFKPIFKVIFCPPMDDDPNHNTYDVQCIVNNEIIGFGAHINLHKAKHAAAYDAMVNNRPKVVYYIKALPPTVSVDVL
ncbi:hypothetical protein BN7_1229 [Wickerhamomyces ciferrii]|uniref:Uncharacterized protein n=1 Tax=Wickerhamomyces ciferrii (strain ATCC 14091 / BCRC 22168 / CBS 111 / JCM 3599 / NBRC 0793 / NRRL Y-1031 F-60-10) TaxID=1206466 RepID=K0KKP5_WICCF|nr:uncharacterized protein BN7_1229 [Wickerhamomyces ciferrii]CCH41688.1 hypothetical protein BN7_1229 [Wickerhamomyces ciferrii]